MEEVDDTGDPLLEKVFEKRSALTFEKDIFVRGVDNSRSYA